MQNNTDSPFKIFLTFLRFGFLAWGGPVAQIAMLREDLVEKRGWVTPDKFNRTLAVYQALPGPEAHELCVYFGMIRAGRLGGLLAGLGFMLPGFLLILLLAYAYSTLGPAILLPYLVGISPAVTALIFRAVYKMGQHTLTTWPLFYLAGIAFLLTLLQVPFFLIFALCATAQGLWTANRPKIARLWLVLGCTLCILASDLKGLDLIMTLPPIGMFLSGLQAGLLSFGGAYTALPFLKDSVVGVYPNVTEQVFLDGIALSSIIPAPLIIFGTFLGFMAEGWSGAFLITLGIFIPAFSFTLLGHQLLEKIVENPAWHGLLDGMTAAVIGLLAVTALQIGEQTLTGPIPIVLFALAFTVLLEFRAKWIIPATIILCGVAGYYLKNSFV